LNRGDQACSTVPKLTIGGAFYYSTQLNAAGDERFGTKFEMALHYYGFSLETEYFWHQLNDKLYPDSAVCFDYI